MLFALLIINWDREGNVFNQNDLKANIHRSYIENTKLPDKFMSTALRSLSGSVYENFKLFVIVTNLSRFLSDFITS